MIVRIVKMVFRKEAIDAFQQLFEERKMQIRQFEGCRHLELWQDHHFPAIFFTYSVWDSEAALETYRASAFFNETWSKTAVLFAGKPEAWTVNQLTVAT